METQGPIVRPFEGDKVNEQIHTLDYEHLANVAEKLENFFQLLLHCLNIAWL